MGLIFQNPFLGGRLIFSPCRFLKIRYSETGSRGVGKQTEGTRN